MHGVHGRYVCARSPALRASQAFVEDMYRPTFGDAPADEVRGEVSLKL